MEFRDISKFNLENKKRRYPVSEIIKFVESDAELDGKILVVYGLRRTGKTTMMEQVALEYHDKIKCAFYEVTNKNTMDDVRDTIIKEQEMGTSLIFIDEITKAEDFITSSAILPDVFAKEGIKIVVSGTDSLGFLFAENDELLDRTIRVKTTHIPLAEHIDTLGIKDVDDYIMYGGLMRKGLNDKYVYDYQSAIKYLDSAVSGNIAYSVNNNERNSSLLNLTTQELQTIIEKMVEIYSGYFLKRQMQEELKRVTVNSSIDLLAKSEFREFLQPLSKNKRDITRDFAKVINADNRISTEITDTMVLELERLLIDMDLLSVTTGISYRYTDEFGWMESTQEKNYYIIQPAIKYNQLKKGLEFIDNELYYKKLPAQLKNMMKQKLEEKIKGDMIEQIIVFDVAKKLSNEQYFVCKPDFWINAQKIGEYDMLIYDKKENRYWSFEIKHTITPYYKQEQHLCNTNIQSVIDYYYGTKMGAYVLYRGESFISSTNVLYINITDFMTNLYNYGDVQRVFEVLGHNLPIVDLYEAVNIETSQNNQDNGTKRKSVLARKQECKREIQEQDLNHTQVRDNSDIRF